MTDDKIIRFMPEFLREGQNIVDFNSAVAEELNITIDFLNDTKVEIQISTASGSNLDDIAVLFKLTRDVDETDNAFRARIQSYISQSKSSGTADELAMTIANFIGLDATNITVTTIAASTFNITILVDEDTDLILLDTVRTIIASSKVAGTYNRDINIESADNFFLLNVSDINGDDLLS